MYAIVILIIILGYLDLNFLNINLSLQIIINYCYKNHAKERFSTSNKFDKTLHKETQCLREWNKQLKTKKQKRLR